MGVTLEVGIRTMIDMEGTTNDQTQFWDKQASPCEPAPGIGMERLQFCEFHDAVVAEYGGSLKGVTEAVDGMKSTVVALSKHVETLARHTEGIQRDVQLISERVERIDSKMVSGPIATASQLGIRQHMNTKLTSILLLLLAAVVIVGIFSFGALVGKDETKRAISRGIDAIPPAVSQPTK